VTVLTNAKGFTLYSFAPDTASRSNCNGTCAGRLATSDRDPHGNNLNLNGGLWHEVTVSG
jgi:predicted lipoprotein with Yx(FWY)xxD motif